MVLGYFLVYIFFKNTDHIYKNNKFVTSTQLLWGQLFWLINLVLTLVSGYLIRYHNRDTQLRVVLKHLFHYDEDSIKKFKINPNLELDLVNNYLMFFGFDVLTPEQLLLNSMIILSLVLFYSLFIRIIPSLKYPRTKYFSKTMINLLTKDMFFAISFTILISYATLIFIYISSELFMIISSTGAWYCNRLFNSQCTFIIFRWALSIIELIYFIIYKKQWNNNLLRFLRYMIYVASILAVFKYDPITFSI